VKTSERIRDRFMPWAGLVLGTSGYFFAHQLGGDSTFQDCRIGSPLMVTVAMIAGLLVIGLGALSSWRVYGAESEAPARRFVSAVGLLACVLFAIGVVLPFIASMVIPRCWA
jgi:hypothetical protein